MARETRRGRGAYFTRSRKVGGRVEREYYGTGPAADLAEVLESLNDLIAQKQAEWWHREQERLTGADEEMKQFFEQTVVLVRAVLLAMGFRKHPTKWRFTQMPLDLYQPEGKELDGEQVISALDKAEQGDREALASVRRLIRGVGIWEEAWSAAIRANQMMIATMTGADPILTVALNEKLDAFRATWNGSAPTRLERLLVERLSLAFLNVLHSEAFAASGKTRKLTKPQRNAIDSRRRDAKKQFDLSKKLLKLIREQLPAAIRRREKQYLSASSEVDLCVVPGPDCSTGEFEASLSPLDSAVDIE